MKRTSDVASGLLSGALAGLAGGLVFGVVMARHGVLPTIASLARAESPVVGFVVHLAVAAVVGAVFGLLVLRQHTGAGETLFWGLAYGMFWWFLGPLTLMPLLLGGAPNWDVRTAQAAFPSLLGHLSYGAGPGLALVALQAKQRAETGALSRGVMFRGALAGLTGGWLLGAVLDAQRQLLAFTAMLSVGSAQVAWLFILLFGISAGLGLALLYPRPSDGAGIMLIRGTIYGFLCWVLVALTLLPLVGGVGLDWSLAAARAGFATLPAYLLSGATVAVLYRWLDGAVRLLFSDVVPRRDAEGVGTQGLRAVGRGSLAGLVGGLVFTLAMVQIDFLPVVARLVGSSSPLAGFLVHLAIANLVGASYGLLFRRQSYDLGMALGWGTCYGFFWWILGPLTLMPILLGATPRWTADVAAEQFPSLVGHLTYGAGLGITFYWLEARSSPWWITRTQAEAIRLERRKEQLLSSAPALWTLVVVIAVTVPIVLGR